MHEEIKAAMAKQEQMRMARILKRSEMFVPPPARTGRELIEAAKQVHAAFRGAHRVPHGYWAAAVGLTRAEMDSLVEFLLAQDPGTYSWSADAGTWGDEDGPYHTVRVLGVRFYLRKD